MEDIGLEGYRYTWRRGILLINSRNVWIGKWKSSSPDHYNLLNTPFSEQEIITTLHQLRKWKSPGPDGIPIGFYIDNWDLGGNFVLDTVLQLLNNQLYLAYFNFLILFLSQKVIPNLPRLIIVLLVFVILLQNPLKNSL